MATKLIDNSAKILAQVRKVVDESVSEVAADIADDVAVLAPKKTGELAASYQSQKIGFAHAQVGSPLKRSIFSDLGTVKMPAKPNLLPACEINADHLPKKIRNKLK